MDGKNGDPTFSVVLQPQQPVKVKGKLVTPTIPTDASWAVEVSLDVQWAHAIAPEANIVLLEAATSSSADMYAMVNTARNMPNVSVVSMSWSSRAEFATETANDSYFTTPTWHTPITFVACSNDWGAPAVYPSASPNVISVGGTTLSIDTAGNYLSESGWSGSGRGVSAYEPAPAYQSALG